LWHNPVPGSLRSIGQDWRDFLRDPWMWSKMVVRTDWRYWSATVAF
jgi:hypothetical protein